MKPGHCDRCKSFAGARHLAQATHREAIPEGRGRVEEEDQRQPCSGRLRWIKIESWRAGEDWFSPCLRPSHLRLEEMRQVRQPWAPHSWRLRLCDVATRWQLLEDVAPAPGRVRLRHGSRSGRGSSCERTMARRRWDAGSSQIAIAAECGVHAVE